jgi:hypothetical protein
MRVIVSWLLAVALLPRVEDPWPDAIGLELPIVLAGAGGVVASVLCANASEPRRDEAIRGAGLWGLRLGALFYLLSLLEQVVSGV